MQYFDDHHSNVQNPVASNASQQPRTPLNDNGKAIIISIFTILIGFAAGVLANLIQPFLFHDPNINTTLVVFFLAIVGVLQFVQETGNVGVVPRYLANFIGGVLLNLVVNWFSSGSFAYITGGIIVVVLVITLLFWPLVSRKMNGRNVFAPSWLRSIIAGIIGAGCCAFGIVLLSAFLPVLSQADTLGIIVFLFSVFALVIAIPLVGYLSGALASYIAGGNGGMRIIAYIAFLVTINRCLSGNSGMQNTIVDPFEIYYIVIISTAMPFWGIIEVFNRRGIIYPYLVNSWILFRGFVDDSF